MQDQRNNNLSCAVCNKEAHYECSQCHNANYCSKEHQIQHWRGPHRASCQPKMNQNLSIKIFNIRKSYFENFSQKNFTQCLLDAKVLSGLQRNRLIQQGQSFELDYGASICLLVKSYLTLNNKKNAKSELEAYLKQKNKFITQQTYENSNSKSNEYLLKKLNFVACIGNLCYAVGINCIPYYVQYTKVVVNFFGVESSQASNCYFLIGCYFAQEGYFKKAIECFKKAAAIRKEGSACDCFFNIAVLYKLEGKLTKALQLLQKALLLREDHQIDDKSKMADINQLMGLIYTQMNDFKTAMIQYDKALHLRKEEENPQGRILVKELIKQLKERLSLFINHKQPKIKRPQIYIQLRSNIQSQPLYDTQQNEEKQSIIKQNVLKSIEVNKKNQQNKTQKKQNKLSQILMLNEQFMRTLNFVELFRLSELQLQLEKCTSQFGVAYQIGTSAFYLKLSKEKLEELKKNNQELFEIIRVEEINKIKSDHK